MNIIINDKYTIAQTEFGYTLKEKIQKRKLGDGTMQNPTGEPYDTDIEIGYYSNVENCIDTIVRLELLAKEDNVNLQGFLKEFKAERERITNLLK